MLRELAIRNLEMSLFTGGRGAAARSAEHNNAAQPHRIGSRAHGERVGPPAGASVRRLCFGILLSICEVRVPMSKQGASTERFPEE